MYTRVYICTVHNVRRRAKNTLRSLSVISMTKNSMKMNATWQLGVRFGSPRMHICPQDFIARHVSLRVQDLMGNERQKKSVAKTINYIAFIMSRLDVN